ncbi:hypothetical protein SAMN04515674_11913 [Pseudarcicella hirudinis]|uniref:Energy-coupling factor transport system substrate-specific component n=1 Tax=Pseudarcicella hirudinis TaxID=1079859 RepID=A0A1I5YIF6_9BACT|nr:hypothetical protein [Pseudarcicella hirudinis]SFQ43999.1 hypothetical protein SAMN04515674_11913 [Pseudarcicella hirudinis]
MIRNTLLTLLATIIVVYTNLNSDVVHIPLLVVLLLSLGLGYLQPQKGWISALQFVIGIFAGYFIGQIAGFEPKAAGINQFSTYISPLPVLFGGFMGSFFRKALEGK